MNPADVAGEIDRARRMYDAYEAKGCYDTAWAPFDEVEAAYRSRQALAMATLMRKAGLRDLSGLRILDVGCGRGRQLRSFIDMGADASSLDGIDIHEPSISVARSLSPQLTFATFNGWEIPYPDKSFSLVTQHVVFSSIALVELRERLAAEMVRVLRPGGYVFWWDTLRLSRFADGEQAPLDVGRLFSELPTEQLRIGQQPTLAECLRVPHTGRRLARFVLKRIRLFDYPTTHLAALIGPKR